MSDALTPPKWIAKLRAQDKVRMDELEKRIERLEHHTHVQSPSAMNTGKPMYSD